MRKINKILGVTVLIFFLIVNCMVISNADTASELNAKQKDIDAQIAEKNAEMNGVKKQMSSTLSQINDLTIDISSYETEISDLQTQIDGLNTQISEKEVVISNLETQYNSQKEALEKRLVTMYETGSTTYLEMLLSSDGLTDFLSKYYLISQIAEYDAEMLQNIGVQARSVSGHAMFLRRSI